MRMAYDPDVDILTIRLTNEAAATTRDNAAFDTIADYDEHDNLIGLELFQASRRAEELAHLDLLVEAAKRRGKLRFKPAPT